MLTLLNIRTVNAPIVALINASTDELGEEALKQRARALGDAMGPGTVSRSYCHPYALVGWHTGPVGVDIERVVVCDERFARSISTPSEKPLGSHRHVVSRWSSKEALAKALGDALHYDPRRLESPAGWVDGASGPWRAETLAAPDGYCAWLCWRDRDLNNTDSPLRSGNPVITPHHDRGKN
jgi:4'-phosphopantetheinyl transferase superfamily